MQSKDLATESELDRGVRCAAGAAGYALRNVSTGSGHRVLMKALAVALLFAPAAPSGLGPVSPFLGAMAAAGAAEEPTHWHAVGAGFFFHRDEERALILATDYHHRGPPPDSACLAYRIQPGDLAVAEIAVDFNLQMSLFRLLPAELRTPATTHAPARLRSSDLKPGDAVFTTGFSAEDGRFIARAARVSDSLALSPGWSVWRLSEPIPPADSGAPLLDGRGYVAGVVISARDLRTPKELREGLSYAVPLRAVRNFLQAQGVAIHSPSDGGSLALEDVQRAAEQSAVRLLCLRQAPP